MMKKAVSLALLLVAILLLPSCNKNRQPGRNVPKLPEAFRPAGVDMGGNILWAEFNLGTTESVQYGYALRWGEWKEMDKDSDYRFSIKGEVGYSAYNDADKLTILQEEDDPAVLLLGDGWRVPTPADFEWLASNCDWKFENDNSTKCCGISATSKINGNRLYFPIHYQSPGAISSPQTILITGGSNYFATNTLAPDKSRNLSCQIGYSGALIDNKVIHSIIAFPRAQKQLYRPVRDK